MRRLPLLMSMALVLGACGAEAPPTPTPSPNLIDAEAGTIEHLRRLYREARAEAAPSRASLIELLGIDPQAKRRPPASQSRPALSDGDLHVEPLVYEAAPGVPVSALLWRPAGDGPFPAVLMTHGHFEGGKHAPAVQARCRDLASAGVLALSIDLFGQGEREALGHANAAELYLAGTSLLALDVQSVVRGIDLLEAREDVDASRLGLAGQSGGAIVAIHAAAIDGRVAATFANSGLHDWEGAVLTTPQCACNYAPNQLRLGTVADAAALIAPRSLFACHGSDDVYLPSSSAKAAQAGQAFALLEREGGHEFNDVARLAQLGYFGGEFSLSSTPKMTKFPAVDAAELLAFGPQGLPAEALTLSDIASERQRALRPDAALPAAELRERLREVLALPEAGPPAERRADRLVLETEPGLELQGWLAGAPSGTVVLILHPEGGRAALQGEYARRFLDPSGDHQVLAVDLRGQGDALGDAWDYLQLHVGAAADAPLLGRRVHDARGWLATAGALAGDDEVLIHATGESAFIAVLLGALNAEAAITRPGVWDELPASLFAEGVHTSSSWGLPVSLAVPGLAKLGDVADFVEAMHPATIRGVLWSLRARDGRPVPAPDPHWERFRQARVHVMPQADRRDSE